MSICGPWTTRSSTPAALQAAAWFEPLKDRLYTRGAAPIVAALAMLRPATPEVEDALHDALSYFTTQAARMDYPRFVARQFPIGSSAQMQVSGGG